MSDHCIRMSSEVLISHDAFLCAQTVNVTFWLTPHVHILLTRCGWFDDIVMASGAIQWTMWNTVSLMRCCAALNAELMKQEGHE